MLEYILFFLLSSLEQIIDNTNSVRAYSIINFSDKKKIDTFSKLETFLKQGVALINILSSYKIDRKKEKIKLFFLQCSKIKKENMPWSEKLKTILSLLENIIPTHNDILFFKSIRKKLCTILNII